VEAIDEHVSFYFIGGTIYTRIGLGLNPKSKGLIRAILIGPEADKFKILKICPRPGTGGSFILEKKKRRCRPAGSTKNQEPASTGLNSGPYLKTHGPRMGCTREPSPP